MIADGFVVVDKPTGWTSHDVVARLRRAAGTRRVGHAGTLDPMATGVLVVGIGWSTKLLTFVVGVDKDYSATVRLGQATSTDDAQGEVTGSADASGVTDAAVAAAVSPLTGRIEQVPSSVSAIKVDGRRSYARVRGGEDVTLAARPVTVSRFDVLTRRAAGDLVDLDIVVTCSSGTYIRALARDLGTALGVGGHLTALRRTRVGPFDLAGAWTMAALTDHGDGLPAGALVAPAAAAGRLLPAVRLGAGEVTAFRHGRPVPAPTPAPTAAAAAAGSGSVPAAGPTLSGAAGADHPAEPDGVLAVLDPLGVLAGIARPAGDRLRPVVVVPPRG